MKKSKFRRFYRAIVDIPIELTRTDRTCSWQVWNGLQTGQAIVRETKAIEICNCCHREEEGKDMLFVWMQNYGQAINRTAQGKKKGVIHERRRHR